jgi:hypothetical protein
VRTPIDPDSGDFIRRLNHKRTQGRSAKEVANFVLFSASRPVRVRSLAMSLDFSQAIPHAATGFGPHHKVFASGRLGITLNDFGGLYEIIYWGKQPEDAPSIAFKGDAASSYTRLFRVQLLVGDDAWHLDFADTEILACGYVSHFIVPGTGVKVRHALTLVHEAMVFSVEVLENPQRLPLRQRFEHHGYTCVESSVRKATAWKADLPPAGWSMALLDHVPDARWAELAENAREVRTDGGYSTSETGLRDGETHIGFIGDRGIDWRTTRSGRQYFLGGSFTDGAHACAVIFANSRAELEDETKWFLPDIAARATAVQAAERKHIAEVPQFESGNRVFDSLAANIPPLVESLIVRDVPGGMRASATHYWVWGWDTMMASDATLLGGRPDFVRDALRFYRDYAHPEKGVGHNFSRDLKIKIPQAPAAQCLYAVMLYQYLVHTGDAETTREFYPFAKSVFEKTLATVNEHGLGKGMALFPDFPQHCGQDGNDLSTFNNSLLYQAARCMETLAPMFGDAATGTQAAELARRLEKSFPTLLWDAEKGYLYDSVNSNTLEPRKSYAGHALLWQSTFANDLIPDQLAACGRFQAKNHQATRGFLPYPRWDIGWDGDGNQLNQIWATEDAFVTRSLAAAGLHDVLERWIDNCAWFWEQLTVIEGYTSSTVNESGTPDAPGGTQAFGAKSIYMAFLGNCAGLQMDLGGVTLQEGLARPIKINQLPFRDVVLDLDIAGPGRFLEKLEVNGTAVHGSRKIPTSLLKGSVKIVARRTETAPNHPIILALHGATVHAVDVAGAKLTAEVSGYGATWLHLHSPKPPKIALDGKPVDLIASETAGTYRALLSFADNKSIHLEIASS